jgi:ABC-type antimicrobial peptide transport system permease subunit
MGASIISATVSPHYFETLGVPILQGRDFAGVDGPDHPIVILINETMAQRYWPDESAIGRTVYERTLSSGRPFRIVGVVADHKLQTVAEASQPTVYFSTTQRPNSFSAVMARTSGDEVVLLRAMEQVLLTLDPQLPIIERQTMREQISATLLPIRIAASALFVVGGVALLLAAIGLYGVLSAVVTRRTREIGVRIAMGATPRSVLSLVTRRGIGITTIGVVLGAVPGAAVAYTMAGVLYGVRPIDPMAWMLALGLVCAVAGAASAIPAWRATRVDPVRALRAE